jgi:cell division protein FtsI/penicillin-binding protein 2
MLMVFFGAVSLLWTVYLFSLQIFDPFNLARQRTLRYTPHKEILVPTRGAIYDSKGSLLVSSVSYYQIDIDRAAVKRWAERKGMSLNDAYLKVAGTIGKYCSVKKEDVIRRLKMGNSYSSIQITNKVRESELEKLITAFNDQDLPGLNHSFSSMRRIYSQGLLAARLLGSVRAESDGYDPATMSKSLYKLTGNCGVEATYDKLLAGDYGWREVVLDANHERVPYPNLHEKRSQNGYNLHLTIDTNIQEIVENALYEGLEKYGAKNGGAIAMDPKTGRILAMAGVSEDDRTIDPGLVRVRSNIPVSFMFEPGSTMKPLTMLAALENKVVSPWEQIPCGLMKVGNRIIKDVHPYTTLRPEQIITKSSNVGIARIAERVGPARLYEKFICYGYGQKTGLNIFGESSGIFAKLDNWDSYTLHSISFGQAISVTAIQHVTAFSAIANGGKLMKPYVVDRITDENGRVVEQTEPTVLREIGSKAVTDTIRYYMETVVDHGTARHIRTDYIRVAGKTGTAQKNVEGTKGYVADKYNAVFVGIFPAEDPQMAILVFYDEPAPGYHYGSTSAAPTFKKIMEDILFMPNCNIIAFNDRLMQTSLKMPDLKGKHLRQAETILNNYGFLYKIEGSDSSSVVVDQFPKPGVVVEPNHPITIKIGKSLVKSSPVLAQGLMPNLHGLTLRKALQVAAQQNIALKIKGSGIIRNQSILPGSRISKGAVCQIEASL